MSRSPTAIAPQSHSLSPLLVYVTAFSLCLVLTALVAYGVDDRLLNGVSVWSKPMKFNFSFALHLVTLAWLWQLVQPAVRTAWPQRLLLPTAAICVLVELLYINLQAARGRHSHYNFETPWETAMYYAVMGGSAVVIVVVTFLVGWLVWRRARADAGPAFRLGAALGLTLSAVATLITAGALASGVIAGPGHWVGGVRSDASGLPLLGWSTTGGDLRVPHFFATHLLQILGVAGWWMDRRRVGKPALILVAMAVLGNAVVVATFVQAVQGKAFLSWLMPVFS